MRCYSIPIMRFVYIAALSLAVSLTVLAQQAPNPAPGLPTKPSEIFAAAAPFYDFTSPELKPWHLKATYQLYDEKGNPSSQGSYEYWWASPKVYRSTWTRSGTTHTTWHTADGKYADQETGERLNFFEYELQAALFSPLPESGDLDPKKYRMERETVSLGGVKFPCIMVIPLMPQHGQTQIVQVGLFPTYCFASQLPALRASFSFGTLAMEFNNIVNVQNRYLARELQFFEGKRKILSAEVDSVTDLSPSDPALTPPANAHIAGDHKAVTIADSVMAGMLVKKQAPVYSQDAKDAHISGTVVLRALIGKDGKIHELHVVSAPWPSLAASALQAVSQWEYKPYLLNGETVDVDTEVNVIFALGN